VKKLTGQPSFLFPLEV